MAAHVFGVAVPVCAGEVVNLPVGGVIRKKTNEGARQADMSRLQSLADILGMDQVGGGGRQVVREGGRAWYG